MRPAKLSRFKQFFILNAFFSKRVPVYRLTVKFPIISDAQKKHSLKVEINNRAVLYILGFFGLSFSPKHLKLRGVAVCRKKQVLQGYRNHPSNRSIRLELHSLIRLRPATLPFLCRTEIEVQAPYRVLSDSLPRAQCH